MCSNACDAETTTTTASSVCTFPLIMRIHAPHNDPAHGGWWCGRGGRSTCPQLKRWGWSWYDAAGKREQFTGGCKREDGPTSESEDGHVVVDDLSFDAISVCVAACGTGTSSMGTSYTDLCVCEARMICVCVCVRMRRRYVRFSV